MAPPTCTCTCTHTHTNTHSHGPLASLSLSVAPSLNNSILSYLHLSLPSAFLPHQVDRGRMLANTSSLHEVTSCLWESISCPQLIQQQEEHSLGVSPIARTCTHISCVCLKKNKTVCALSFFDLVWCSSVCWQTSSLLKFSVFAQ